MHNRFLSVFHGTALATLLMTVAGNVYFDPFDILGTSTLRQGYATNDRVNKIRQVLKDTAAYNSFILGSSRMGQYSPASFNEHYPGARFYNLSYLSALPGEILQTLETLKANDVAIHNVVIGLDLYFFETERNRDSPTRWMPPEVSGEDRHHFELKTLLYPAYVHWASKWTHAQKQAYEIHHDYADGTYDYPKAMAEDWQPEESFARIGIHWSEPAFLNFKKLTQWLTLNNVNAIYFIHPHSSALVNSISTEDMARFRSRIAEVVPGVLDYSSSPLAEDPANFYDISHYRTHITAKITSSLLDRKTL